MALRWAEISNFSERKRFDVLSVTLQEAGVENQVEYIESTPEALEKDLTALLKDFDQIRISGSLCETARNYSTRMPTLMLSLKSADAFVKRDGVWWPQNYLFEGMQRALVTDVATLDLTGAAFIMGSTCEARAAIASLVRIGFSRFSISDPSEDKGHALVEDLRQTYFRVQFQFVPRHLITQLPSVHSVAVNTLSQGRDEGSLTELFYFNFLKVGGIWIDLALQPPNPTLEAEARAVGAMIEHGHRVAAWTDCQWAVDVLQIKLDVNTYASSLAHVFLESFNKEPQ